MRPFSQTRLCEPSGEQGRGLQTALLSQLCFLSILLPHGAVMEWPEAARSTGSVRTGLPARSGQRGHEMELCGCRVGKGRHPAGIGGPWRVLRRQGTEYHMWMASGRRTDEEESWRGRARPWLLFTCPGVSESLLGWRLGAEGGRVQAGQSALVWVWPVLSSCPR